MKRDAGRSRSLAATLETLGATTHAICRIGAGFLFLEHGAQKLFGLLGGKAVPLVSLMGLAGVLELFGGLLVMLGLWTRPLAFLLTGEMVTAYLLSHLPRGGWPIENRGELALMYALIFLFLLGHGAGPVSFDAWLRRAPADSKG